MKNSHSNDGFGPLQALVPCSLCRRQYWEAVEAIEIARLLDRGLLCIECDPDAVERERYFLTIKGQAESY